MTFLNFNSFSKVTLTEENRTTLNDPLARYNECMAAWHILNESWKGRKPPKAVTARMEYYQKEADTLAKDVMNKVSGKEAINLLKEQDGRAKASAKASIELARQKDYTGDIIDIDHTGAGGIQKYGDTKDSNASDIVMKFSEKNKKADGSKENQDKLGVSLKSSKNGNIGFYNGGASTHTAAMGSADLGENAETFKQQKQKEIFGNISQVAIKKIVRDIRKKKEANAKAVKEGKKPPMPLSKKEQDIDDKVQKAASDVHSKFADNLADAYNDWNKKDVEAVRSHIGQLVLRSDPNNKLPHIKTTGFGELGKLKPGEDFKAHSTSPEDNPMNEAVKNATSFSFHRTGNSYIHVVAHIKKPDGTQELRHLFSYQIKHNDDKLSSSLKVIGQPSTKSFDSLPIYDEKKVAARNKEEDTSESSAEKPAPKKGKAVTVAKAPKTKVSAPSMEKQPKPIKGKAETPEQEPQPDKIKAKKTIKTIQRSIPKKLGPLKNIIIDSNTPSHALARYAMRDDQTGEKARREQKLRQEKRKNGHIGQQPMPPRRPRMTITNHAHMMS